MVKETFPPTRLFAPRFAADQKAPEMTDAAAVPELSLAAFEDPAKRGAAAETLYEGLTRYGFVILKDHPVSADVLAGAYRLAAAFFARPDAEKRRYVVGADGQRGYTPFGVEHAKDAAVADLKEFWHVGREDGRDLYADNVWPDAPEGFRETFLALYAGLERAGDLMLAALAPKLGLPDDYFAKMTAGGDSILRLLHYPPVPEDADPAAVRAAAHEDINLITLLVSAEGAGLELLDRDGRWRAVEAAPEHIIVDAGDMLARITNGVIPATTHRVVNPAGPNVSRYSMPFFLHPRPEAVLSVIPSCRDAGPPPPEDVTARDFLRQRLREIGLLA